MMKLEQYNDILFIVLLTALATLTRMYGLNIGDITGDELWTANYFNVRYLNSSNPMYYALVKISTDFFGISRWSLRLPAAILGIISIPIFYSLCKSHFNRRTSFIGGIILIFNPWHLDYSQDARFYSGVFLFGLLSYFMYFKALKNHSYLYLFIMILSSVIGVLFHASFILIPVSLAIFTILTLIFLREDNIYLSKSISITYIALILISSIVMLPYIWNTVNVWIQMHPNMVFSYGNLLSLRGFSLIVEELLRLSYRIVYDIGITIFISALFGGMILFKKNLIESTYFNLNAALPITIILVSSIILPAVRPRYIFFSLPIFIVLSAVLCDEISHLMSHYKLGKHVVTFLVIVGLAPGFVTHYTAQSSLHIDDALSYIDAQYSNGDLVIAHEKDAFYKIMTDYNNWEWVRAPGASGNWEQEAQRALGGGNRVWFIINSSNIPGVSQEFEPWLIENASLVWRKDRKGFVYGLTGYEVWMAE